MGARPPTTKPPRDWLGLQLSADFAWLPGARAVCSPAAQAAPDAKYQCFAGDVAYPGAVASVDPAASGTIEAGLAFANLRVLVSYDRAVSPHVTVGGRAGLAIRGAPADFIPVHADGRVTYWFGGPVRGGALRPQLFAAGGLGEVNAAVPVALRELPDEEGVGPTRSVQAWGRFGTLFVSTGVGVGIGLSDSTVLSLEASAKATFPDTTFVVTPTAGVTTGI